MTDIYSELMKLVSHLEGVVAKQNTLIAQILNENAEKENAINVMMQEHTD